jgi:hypothetical protein
MRHTDNRFYWLAADEVQARHVTDVKVWNGRLAPATLQANVFAANQIHVRVSGINQVTVWLGPSMIDFAKPVTFRVNGRQVGPMRVQPSLATLLEDFYERGDRQQLYFARLSGRP